MNCEGRGELETALILASGGERESLAALYARTRTAVYREEPSGRGGCDAGGLRAALAGGVSSGGEAYGLAADRNPESGLGLPAATARKRPSPGGPGRRRGLQGLGTRLGRSGRS